MERTYICSEKAKHEAEEEICGGDAGRARRKGKELRAITFMRGHASKEQMTWKVTGVTLRGNWYCIALGKRVA